MVVIGTGLGALGGMGAVWGLRARRYRGAGETGRVERGPWWVLIAALVIGAVWSDVVAPEAPVGIVVLPVVVCWLAAAEIDLDVHRLPDRLTLTTWGGYAAALVMASVLGSASSRRVLVAMVCSLMLAGAAFALGLATGQVGLGDVKLLGGVGLVLGSISMTSVVCAVAVMSVVGAVCATVAVARGAGRTHRLAAGPGIVVGALAGPVLATFV